MQIIMACVKKGLSRQDAHEEIRKSLLTVCSLELTAVRCSVAPGSRQREEVWEEQ